MITPGKETHKDKKNKQHNEVGRNPDEYTGYSHAERADDNQRRGPEAVGEPSGRQLSGSAGESESSRNSRSLEISPDFKIITNRREQWLLESHQEMMSSMREDKKWECGK